MDLAITHNIRSFRKGFVDKTQRQLPFAISLAINDTAADVKQNTERRLDRVLDRPTPFTRRGLFLLRARKTRLRSTVGFKDIQAGYLEAQEEGGVRRPKRGGRAILIPVGARLNRYGNMAQRAVARMLARPDTFSGRIGAVGGIWQRKRDGSVKLLVAYESQARYRPRLGFVAGADKTARARFQTHLDRSLRRALASAK